MLLGDAERLRWFLLPSEAHAFLRGETRDGYPRIPPFTPLRRCYYGKSNVNSSEVVEADDKGENNKCEQENNRSCCEDKNETSEGKHEFEAEKCDDTADFDVCKSEHKNTREVFHGNDGDMRCSTEDSCGIKQNQRVRFHNPPRHVFNLTVKVCS